MSNIKEITLTFDERDYVLTFTRGSIKKAERGGFSISKVDEMPATMLPELFASAFIAKHPQIRRERVDEIFKATKDKNGLFEVLSKLYANTINSLLDDPEENEKNATWVAN